MSQCQWFNLLILGSENMAFRHPDFAGFLRNSIRYRQYRFLLQKPWNERLRPQCSSFHTTGLCEKKSKLEPSSQPYKFTTSPANFASIRQPVDKNKYQPLIVAVSLFVFLTYFMYFREENDLDEALNVPLFERVPQVEEPHLTQAIPQMRARGEDTTEAEARLKELIQQRLEKERQQKSK